MKMMPFFGSAVFAAIVIVTMQAKAAGPSCNVGPAPRTPISQIKEQIATSLSLRPKTCQVVDGHPTFYDPRQGGQEGGSLNRHGERINSVEMAIEKGWPITVAADSRGEFAKRCNWKKPVRRCVLLVHAKGFDKIYPAYRKKFSNLPEDSFVAIVEDTGSPKYFSKRAQDKDGRHLDIAAFSRGLARAAPKGFNRLAWSELAAPCEGTQARKCDFSKFQLNYTPENTTCWPKGVQNAMNARRAPRVVASTAD